MPFPRMTYAEAMRRYGSDKPDLRFDLELVDLTEHMAGTEFRVFQAEHVGAVVVPGGAAYTRKELDAWQEWAKRAGRQGHRLAADPRGRRARAARSPELEPRAAGGAARGGRRRARRRDPVRRRPAAYDARAARRAAARGRPPAGPDREDEWRFLWIVDAPMFEPTASRRRRAGWLDRGAPPVHRADHGVGRHASTTTPSTRWRGPTTSSATASSSAAARSVSIAREMQQRVFDVIGLTPRARRRASSASCSRRSATAPPPHGGIAFGLDRLALPSSSAPTRSAR